ncbi:DUF2407 C-terminal domain-containing protein [Scheffersomyces coipomensis]|uniref:DUF2407 C-terminal domain-containing protein n=1 Tax=Scheffersomyces coipomensis TaxID=1788519 RepID=UPI00315D8166
MKWSLIIRFTNTVSSKDQVKDLDIPISVNFSKDDINKLINISWIKNIIRSRIKQCKSNRLRLIYNGRVLNERTNFKSEIFEPRLRYIEQQQEEEQTSGQLQSEPPSNDGEKIYIHCVIGEELTSEQLIEENQLDNKPQEISTTPQVIGFDRLLQQGFSQDDINDLRRQFYSIYSPSMLQSNANREINDLEEEEQRTRDIRQLEERWIESTVNGNGTTATPTTTNSSANVPGSGGNSAGVNTVNPDDRMTGAAQAPAPSQDLDDVQGNEDLLLGLLLGTFLGVVSVIFLAADDTVFNKRVKTSMIVGVFINFSFAIVRGQWI